MRLSAEAENRPKSAHRYNVAEQQQIYKSEIERIWKAQFDSLSRKDEPQLTPEDEAPPPPPDTKKIVQRQGSMRIDTQTPFSPAMSPAPGRPTSPAYSRGSSLERDREMSMGPEGSRKVLRIKRLVGHLSYLTRQSRHSLSFRSMTSGKRKSFAIQLSSARMSVHDTRSRKRPP